MKILILEILNYAIDCYYLILNIIFYKEPEKIYPKYNKKC